MNQSATFGFGEDLGSWMTEIHTGLRDLAAGRDDISRYAVQWFLSPHPGPLPWGEGEPCSPRRTIQISQLCTGRCALSPLPEGEGQGEGNSGAYHPDSRPAPGTFGLRQSSGKAQGFPT